MNMFSKATFILALCVTMTVIPSLNLIGQSKAVNREAFRLQAKKTDQPFIIDGILDESIWSECERTTPFHRMLPIDTGYAQAQTEVMIAYDEENFYMGIICHDTLPGNRPAESMRRDFSFGKNDNFFAAIDTYNDQTNGFAFGISSAGAQWDGMQANGGIVANEWDGKYYSAVQNYPDYWTAELSIPFKTVRYREGDTEWGINFSRLDLKANEKSAWTPVPRQFQSANLAYTGTLAWEDPPPPSGVRFSLIPYASGKATHQKEAGEDIKLGGGAGLDAKVILSTSMNLDMTINPDYSQVEVDRQQLNLDRFELFFPEKRKFFLENSDLFANLGARNLRPFFSRRIGLNTPVIAGARLSGTAGENLRVGLMNMQTGAKDGTPANNFSVATMQRNLLSRSNITLFMTNKQAINVGDDTTFTGNLYNRVAGAEFNFASASDNWTGKAFYHHSFAPEQGNNSFTTAASLLYSTQQFAAGWSQAYVGDNYLAEMGFVRRRGFLQSNPTLKYQFYPMGKRITNHGPTASVDLFFEPDFSMTDRSIELGYSITFVNRSRLSFNMSEQYIRLLDPFDPTNTGGEMLPADSDFSWMEASMSFLSSQTQLFTYQLEWRYGGFYNGTRFTVNADLNYRVQPYGNLSLVTSFNRVELPEPYTSTDLILIGPRLDVTFTNKLFLTTFVQYNNQIDNINTNIRFQWRFAPVSDLFIVYTENTHPAGLKTRDRGIVIKLSYWIN